MLGKLIKWLVLVALGAVLAALLYLGKCLVTFLIWLVVEAVKHPRTTATVLVVGAGVVLLGQHWQAAAWVSGGLVVGGIVWWLVDRASFEATLGRAARSWWRRWWIYRRRWSSISA